MYKRIISLLLVIVLCMGFFPAGAFAENESNTTTETESDVQIQSTSDFGNLLANAIEEEESTESESSGGDTATASVVNATVAGTTVTVEYTAQSDADCIAAIYNDAAEGETLQLITTATVAVEAGSGTVDISITETIPEYFVLCVYMLDTGSHEPVSEKYSTSYYTQAFQEFLRKPLDEIKDEYGEERVLVLEEGNLGNGSDSNLAVFNEDTIIINQESSESDVVTSDGNGTYTITNATEKFTSLSVGDTFSYNYQNGTAETMLIVRVAAISVDGTTVTITEDSDAELNDVFEVVRIYEDGSAANDASVDTSNTPEGLTYLGENIEDEEPADETEVYENDSNEESKELICQASAMLSDSKDKSEITILKSTFKIEPDIFKKSVKAGKYGEFEGKLSGKLSIEMSIVYEFYLNEGKQYTYFATKSKSAFEGGISGSFEFSVPLCTATVPTEVPGLFFYFTLDFKIKAELAANFKIEYEVEVGHEFDSSRVIGDKNRGIKKTPDDLPLQWEASGKLFIGLEMGLGVAWDICNPTKNGTYFVNIEGTVDAGVEVSSKYSDDIFTIVDFKTVTELPDSQHLCDKCLDINLNFKVKLEFALKGTVKDKFLKHVETSFLSPTLTIPLGIAHWSISYNDFGFCKCPYYSSKVTFNILNEAVTDIQDELSELDRSSFEYKMKIKDYIISDATIVVVNRDTGYEADCGQVYTDEFGNSVIYLEQGNYFVSIYNDEFYDELEITVADVPREYDILMSAGNPVKGTFGDSNQFSWRYFQSTGMLSVSGEGALPDLSDYSEQPWRNNEAVDSLMIKSIVVNNGITSIGSHYFERLRGCDSVSVPQNLEAIGEYAFKDCGIENIRLYLGTNISKGAFLNCYSLKTVSWDSTLGNWNYLIGKSNKVNTVLTKYDMTENSALGNANLDFHGNLIDDGTVGELRWTLYKDGELKIEGEGELEFDSQPWIDYLSGDYAIKKVTLSTGITSICDGAFSDCKELKEIFIPSNVESIGSRAFYNCKSLSEVTLPSNLKTLSSYMFYNCTSLDEVAIPDGVETIEGHAFSGCWCLKDVNIPFSVKSILKYAFFVEWGNFKSNLEVVYEGLQEEWEEVSVSEYGNSILFDGKHLRTFSDNLEEEGTCGDNLKYYVAKDTDGNCILVINGSGDMTSHPWTSSCGSKIIKVRLSEEINSICQSAFYNCTELTELKLPSNAEIGSCVVYGCSKLEKLTIKLGSHTLLYYIAGSPDDNNEYFSKGKLPHLDSLQTIILKGSDEIVSNALNPIYQYHSTTGMYRYNYGEDCLFNNLKTVYVDSGTKCIGSYAFYGLQHLEDVYYGGSASAWNTITIGSNNESLTSATLYVKDTDSGEYVLYEAYGHNYVLVSQQDASAEADGVKEHYICTHCGKLFILNDSGDYIEVTEEELAIVYIPKEHVYEFVPEQAATAEADGVKEHYICTNCGKLFILNGSGECVEVTAEELVLQYVAPEGTGETETEEPGTDEATAEVDEPEEEPESIEKVGTTEETEPTEETHEQTTENNEELIIAGNAISDTPVTDVILAENTAYYHGVTDDSAESAVKNSSFTGLVANEKYVLLVLKSDSEDALLDTDNILFIDQGKADENGRIEFSYIMKDSFANPIVRVYGLSSKSVCDDCCEISLTRGLNDRNSYVIKVTYDGTELVEKTDYNATLEKGEGSNVILTISGLRDYSGTKTFTIQELTSVNGTVIGVKIPESYTVKLTDSEGSTVSNTAISFTDLQFGDYTLSADFGSRYVSASQKLNLWSRNPVTVDIVCRLYGDVYEDGRINVIDVNMTRRCIVQIVQLPELSMQACDVNGDGEVNVLDTGLIRKYAAGLITEFPAKSA